jgi:hypothetical protein
LQDIADATNFTAMETIALHRTADELFNGIDNFVVRFNAASADEKQEMLLIFRRRQEANLTNLR